MQATVIKNIKIVNEGEISTNNVFIENGIIQKIGNAPISSTTRVIDGRGKYLLPGVIDGQVHFRDPGFTYKADLHTESKAAVSGGVTSFIDMPNTLPNVLTLESWKDKYQMAARKSMANYGFFMGVNAENIDHVLQMDTSKFLAVSDDGLYFTKKGNLLADNISLLDKLFKECACIIALHAEKEKIIEDNEELFRKQFGDQIPFYLHPVIRSEEACLRATEELIALAKKHNARLHILHLTTEVEALLFSNDVPLTEKKITTEVCVQHLWFSEKDYDRLGSWIKWNPAIKTEKDRNGLLQALLDDYIDIVTTDHAPHTLEEKRGDYFTALSGGPMVQHSLNIMLEFFKQGLISLEKIVEKMCHNPTLLYKIENRGYIKEGYAADITLVDMDRRWKVAPENILYKCGWSPLEGTVFQTKVLQTFVNGNLVFDDGRFDDTIKGQPLKPVVNR